MVKRILIGLVALVVVAYLAVLGGIFLFQRQLQYEPGGPVVTLAETSLTGVEEVAITGPDGGVVHGWYHPPAPGMATILFYKGNSKTFGTEHARYERWVADGYGFLAFDYRGFPASPGEINQANILSDSLAAFDWLAAKQDHILIWGRSLGSGPATYVASLRKADALLLETPYTSTGAVGAERYWYLPIALLMQDQFPLDQWLKSVEEPVMVAHGTGDRTIPVHHGEDVFKQAPNPKELWIVPDAGHSDLWGLGLADRAEAFFAGVEGAGTQA